MKHIASILLTVILSFLFGRYLPWWSIIIAPFLAGYIFKFKPGVHLLLGFISIFCLWGIQAIIANNGQAADLTIRIGTLFNGLSPAVLIFITATLGGLYGGLAQLCGRFLNLMINNEK